MDILAPTLILVGLLLAMYGAARFARSKLGVGARMLDARALKIVGKRSLERRTALYVVQVADRYVLVGGTDHSLNFIDHISAEEYDAMIAPEEFEIEPASFSTLFAKARTLSDAPGRLAAARAKSVARNVDETPATDNPEREAS